MAKSKSETTLGDYLLDEGLINQTQFNKALEQQRSTSRSLGRILVEMGLITEAMRMTILQKHFGFEMVRLKDFKADQMLLTLIPYTFAEKHRVVPIKQEARALKVAMEDPSDILLLDALKHQVGMPIQPVVATQEDIQNILTQYQTGAQEARDRELATLRPKPIWFRIIRGTAFPILALGPLIFFLVAVAMNMFGWADALQHAHNTGDLTRFSMMLYVALIWSLWTIILFEINGLIFGNKKRGEDEDLA